MSAESPFKKPYEQETPIEGTDYLSEAEIFQIKNQIQIALMKECGIEKGDHDGALAWVKKYAKDFSDYLHEHPQLPLDWHNGNKEAILKILIEAEAQGFPHQDSH